MTMHAFRRYHRQQETLVRAAMPRLSAMDALPLPAFAAPRLGEVVAARRGTCLVRPLTFTLQEVAHG